LQLRRELEIKLSPGAAQIYQEAIGTLGKPGNPERQAICCYLLRELMHSFTRDLIGLRTDPLTSGDLVRWVEQEWKMLASSPARFKRDGGWRFNPWQPIAAFLRALGEQLGIHRNDFPKHRELRLRAFRLLDPDLGELDEADVLALMKDWEKFERYFNGVLHHGKDPADCEETVAAFERFVGERLNPARPPVFATRRRISDLVKEAETNAQP
jgi:hypothetical protein